jgi:hypothetical protein
LIIKKYNALHISILLISSTLFFPVNSVGLERRDVLNLDGFYGQVEDYLKSYYDPSWISRYNPRDVRGHFSYKRGGSQDLYGSADMVYVLYALDELDERTTPEGRKEWAEFIQSCQDPDTGWFTGNNVTLHFKAHSTAYAIAALKMLGSKPLYPLSSAQRITRSRDATEKWLGGILWLYIWVGSHQGGGIAAALHMTGEAPDEWFEWYFDWLDKEVNPETGLWQRAPWNIFYTKPLLEEMGGAPHFWWIYHHRNRSLPYPEKIIDTCLSLQGSTNLWNQGGKKGIYPCCLDVDAVHSIHMAYLQLSAQGVEYRTGDVRDSLESYLTTACNILNQEGSLDLLYDDSHKLTSCLAAVASAQNFFAETMREPRLQTRRPLKIVLDEVPWL